MFVMNMCLTSILLTRNALILFFSIIIAAFSRKIYMNIVKIILSIDACHESKKALLVYCYHQQTSTWMTIKYLKCVLQRRTIYERGKKYAYIRFSMRKEKIYENNKKSSLKRETTKKICLYIYIQTAVYAMLIRMKKKLNEIYFNTIIKWTKAPNQNWSYD